MKNNIKKKGNKRMKNMRRIASLLLALALVFSLAISASAGTITITGSETAPTAGHTYKVYQIFTGDLSNGTLSNIKYGENYYPDSGKKGDLVPDTELEAIKDARAFAEDLVSKNKLKGTAVATLSGDNMTATVVDGYYLIVDEGGENVADGDSLSAYIVQVVGTVNVTPKSETIVPDKRISSDDYADNYNGDDSVTSDGKTSNGGVGTKVNYELTVKVPAKAENYTYYYCVLNDTLSEGLTFNDDVVVKVSGQEAALVKDTDYKLYTGDAAGDKTFQVAMLKAKSLAGKTITVTYSATINEKAVIGTAGNANTYDVDYSNNPEYKYDDNNNNGKPDDAENTPIGNTPDQTTHTYVTGVKLKKVDEKGNVLTGAQFEITGDSVKFVLTSTETFVVDENGEYWKLTNDTYTTEEPRATVKYVEKTDGDRSSGYVKDNDTYREATTDELEGDVQLYTKLESNASSYDNTETKYKKTITYDIKGDETDEMAIAYVGADGVVYFNGLGEGVYTIKETVTPAGYNTIDNITLTIDWTAPTNYPTSTDCTWSATAQIGENGASKNLTLNSEGVFEIEVENRSGSTLPSTGGVGTTMFYVIGSVLVLAAVVLLVTKKRMGTAE